MAATMGISCFPYQELRKRPSHGCLKVTEPIYSRKLSTIGASPFTKSAYFSSKKLISTLPRCSGPTGSSGEKDKSSNQDKTPFGYTRKDVLLIGIGVTVAGIGLKSGLEYVGIDPLQAGNVVQLVLVLGLTVGWISTYIFRVSNKEMTYAQQLRDYEDKVMQKRLESLTEAEIEALFEQVEEEKKSLARGGGAEQQLRGSKTKLPPRHVNRFCSPRTTVIKRDEDGKHKALTSGRQLHAAISPTPVSCPRTDDHHHYCHGIQAKGRKFTRHQRSLARRRSNQTGAI
ncbi:Unknown protein [Striga hermonthica]|uniref:Uncharacterized protein n=1 Tax=Striga hermonthica TaxID=68872 RepID=A0A9N7NR08_STRHE|nr:Unknown protein [Striga hermonthica]